jgi:biofilm PGA synthesis N-glycosyltransferase PgaC
MSDGRALRIAIGISAHNEEENIGALLDRLARVDLGPELRIVVVASGCTDATVPTVQRAARRDPRIELIIDPERRGKAAAINQLLDATRDADVIVGESADTLPEPGAIEAMVARFADPKVGMVGARPVPQDDESTFVGYATQLLWRLHHAVASRSPKQGELVAWRNVVAELPADAIADEAYLEAEITRLGYTLVYEATAIVHNRGPATIGAFLTQRRRNHAIHRTLAASTQYRPATRDHLLLARLGLAELFGHPGRAHWTLAAAVLELWSSMLGLWDHRVARRDHKVWQMVEGTKGLAQTTLAELPLVAVLIVTYNGRDDLRECLASVKRQRYTNYKIVVVDNDSVDGSADAVRAEYPEAEVLRLPTNEGLAAGFNAGIARALELGCRYVLNLNDDVVIANDFLEHAVGVAASEPRAASVTGPVFYYDEPERLWYAGSKILWWLGKTYHIGRRVIWGPAFREPLRLEYSSGAAALYSAAALRAVGGWDEEYFLVFEDADWCVRACRAGWYHRYVPGPKAWHKVSASMGGEKAPLYLYFLFRNNLRFMRRYARPWHWPTFLAFFALESLGRYSLGALAAPPRAIRLAAIWLAVWDAARGRYRRGSSTAIVRWLGRRAGRLATASTS